MEPGSGQMKLEIFQCLAETGGRQMQVHSVQTRYAIVIGLILSAPADRLRGTKRAKQHIKHRIPPSIGAIRSIVSLVQRLYVGTKNRGIKRRFDTSWLLRTSCGYFLRSSSAVGTITCLQQSHVFVKLRRIGYTMVARNRDCLDVGRTGW